MILSAGIKKIYESIKGIKDENKKKELVKSLENKIIESKVLSHVFGLISEVNSKAGKLDQIGTNKFFKELKEKEIITGGMIPKLENAFEAISEGVESVIIGHADDLAELISGNTGTCIR